MAKRIEIEVGGVTVTARLLEKEAPETSSRVWEALPVEATLRHMRWGGNAAYILAPSIKDPSAKVENQVSFYIPGTICLRPEHGEVAFPYGQAQARSLTGNAWATYFADLEGDTNALFDQLRSTQRQGGKPITIRRKEG